MKKIIAYGEPLEETRTDGSVGVSGDSVNFIAGASRLNAAIASLQESREPVEFSILTALGADARGDTIVDFLKANRVSTELVQRNPDKKTAAYTIAGSGGAANFTFHDRADSAVRYVFEPEGKAAVDKALAKMDGDTYFIVSGIGASRPKTPEAFAALIDTVKAAKAKGAHIVVDPNIRPALWDKDEAKIQRAFAQLLPLAETVFITDPDDTKALFGDKAPRAVAEELLKLGVKNAIVKQGDKGATLFTRDRTHGVREENIPVFAVPADSKLDMTGAGDTFMAGAVTSLAHGASMHDALVVGARAASQVIQHPGGVLREESVPSAAQLRQDREAANPFVSFATDRSGYNAAL